MYYVLEACPPMWIGRYPPLMLLAPNCCLIYSTSRGVSISNCGRPVVSRVLLPGTKSFEGP